MSSILSATKLAFAYGAYGLAILCLFGSGLSVYIGATTNPPTPEFLASECQKASALKEYADFDSCMADATLAASSTQSVAGLMAAIAIFMALIFYVIGRVIMGKQNKAAQS
ncbi:hypothetical protein N8835_05265 [Alphaproteobacteria bacterium]|jgi:hypothetical protein|nr:hypothetical protein [Alphaproteobacteria bacterium]